jgi:cathepsin L
MNPTSLAVLLAFAAVALAAKEQKTFENRLEHLSWADYKTTFGKTYASKAVELERMLTYLGNKEYIRTHNEAYAQGKETYWLAINKFADMKPSEFEQYKGYNAKMAKKSMKNSAKFSSVVHLSNDSVPDQVDWRDSGLVSEVKDQGQCGSCWAFSATGSLEGQNMRAYGKLVSLSEQNLVDCSSTSKYGNEGCNGGLMDSAFQYVIDVDGLNTEKSYKYEARKRRCRFKKENIGGNATDFIDVDDDEDSLKEAVGTQGPISVAIDAEYDFQMYGGGVFKSRQCGKCDALDHGVLAVGYGNDKKGGDFWIVKNSWGGDWGEDGYIRMARNKNNMCGIACMASYPVVGDL